MNFALILKSTAGTELRLYDDSLSILESESFEDLYTLNFHLQTLAKKHNIKKTLIVIHDADKNHVDLELAGDENSLFVS